MAFRTGRSRTLSISGVMAGDYSFCIDTELIGVPTATHTKQAAGSVQAGWGTGAIVSWQQAPTTPTVGGNHFYGTTVSASDGFGHSGSNQAGSYIHQSIGPGINIDWELSATGTWSFSCDVEEWAEVYTPTSSTVLSGSSFPNFGGTAQADGLPASGIRYYELAKVGGTLSVHVDFGGASVTLSNPIATAFPISYDQIGIVNSNVFGASNVYTGTSSVSLDAGVSLPSITWTDTDSDGTSTANALGTTLTVQTQNSPGATAGGHGSASAAAAPSTNFSLDGRLRCFDHDFPSPGHTLRIQSKASATQDLVLNSTGTTSWIQNAYNVAATLQGVNYGPSAVDERGPVSCWMVGLGADDARDWRCMFRGFRWDAISLTRASSVVIDPCSALTHWTAGAHTSLSIAGGSVKATASGGTGSLSLAVPTSVRIWEIYRFLQISGSFDPGYTMSPPTILTLQVSLAGESWDLTFGTSSSSPQLDLCCATADTESSEGIQTRFPIASPGIFPTAYDPLTAYKMGWGVQFADSLTISGIPDGMSITLSGIELVTSSNPAHQSAITLLEPFQAFVDGWTSPTDNTLVQPYCLIESDDRVCDLPALAHVVPFMSADSYVWYSIAQLQAMLAVFPGLTATLLPDPSDGYHGSGLAALLLGGEGATLDFSTVLWTDWIDQPIGGALPAQDLWDEVQVYPGAGEVWSQSGAYASTIPLHVSKSLRAQAWGLGFNGAGAAQSGMPIVVYETATPSITEGTGTTNSLGFYLSESPWIFGNVGTTIELHTGSIPYLSVTGTPENRSRLRASFRAVLAASLGNGYDVSNSLRHVRTTISGTHILMGTADNVLPQTWVDRDTGLVGTWARPRFADHGPNWPIGLFYGDGSTCTFSQSFDEGLTWGVGISMASGSFGDFEEGANGLRWLFKLDSSDGGATWDVWGKVLDAQLNVVRNWTITSVTHVDNAPIAVRESPANQGAWHLGLLVSVGGVPTLLFSFDGLTFA